MAAAVGGAVATVVVVVAVKAVVMEVAKEAAAGVAKAAFAAPTATHGVAAAVVAAAIELQALSKRPFGAFSFGGRGPQAGGARCLRGRPANRRSYSASGSRRKSLATTPMGQGTTR